MRYTVMDSVYCHVEFEAAHKALLCRNDGGVDRFGEVDEDWWPLNEHWEYDGGITLHDSLGQQLNGLRERYINDLIIST